MGGRQALVEPLVRTSHVSPEITLVEMVDRVNHNTFTPAFVRELLGTFEHIAQDASTKVVVVSGYDTYFCCGGSKEELLRIISGEITFKDLGFYRLLLDCPVPTIAAMQGHAIGGGLAFGCYADVLVLAEEALYTANFMRFGFTPGMGSTFIVPAKFGAVLGAEMLLSGRAYPGRELKSRGVGALTVRRGDVLGEALKLARELADKPRQALELLKRELTRSVVAALPEVTERELAMHRVTLSAPSVRERVEALFGP